MCTSVGKIQLVQERIALQQKVGSKDRAELSDSAERWLLLQMRCAAEERTLFTPDAGCGSARQKSPRELIKMY